MTGYEACSWRRGICTYVCGGVVGALYKCKLLSVGSCLVGAPCAIFVVVYAKTSDLLTTMTIL